MDERPDVIVVPGLLQADCCLDRADADDALVAAVDQHEHVARISAIGGAGKRCKRTVDALGEALAIGWQRREPGAGALRQRKNRRQIVARDRADEKHP